MTQYEIDQLTCTKCGELQGTHSEIVYSQGDLVCLDCKKENQQSDNNAYDRWATRPR